jgi:hypothetical protein
MSSLAITLIEECIATKATRLDLGKCNIRDDDVIEGTLLDKLLRECTHLKTLILSNRWYEWGTDGNYKFRDSNNNGRGNIFSKIPPSVTKLTGLHHLFCSGDDLNQWKIKDMKCVESLINLQTLTLSDNEITTIEGLENLGSLLKLDLNANRITEIKGLQNLYSLTHLSPEVSVTQK